MNILWCIEKKAGFERHSYPYCSSAAHIERPSSRTHRGGKLSAQWNRLAVALPANQQLQDSNIKQGLKCRTESNEKGDSWNGTPPRLFPLTALRTVSQNWAGCDQFLLRTGVNVWKGSMLVFRYIVAAEPCAQSLTEKYRENKTPH